MLGGPTVQGTVLSFLALWARRPKAGEPVRFAAPGHQRSDACH